MDETFSEIGRVFRSVGKLVREKTEDYFGNVTPVERALREVTDEGCCTIPNSLLRELAKASNDINSYHPIMQCIWQGLAQEGAAWRRTYKSLCLLEYVILFGPRRALEDCRHAMMRIKYLSGFRYHDGTREQGGGVRQKSHYIMELIEQPEMLTAARQKALEDSERYVGIENRPVFDMQGLGSLQGGGGFGGHSSSLSSIQGPPDLSRGLPPAAQSWSPFFTGPPAAPFGHPPDNPFATINAFQSEADARRTWNVQAPASPATSFAHGYDVPTVRTDSAQGSVHSASNSASYERSVMPSTVASQRGGKVTKSKAAKTAVNLLSVDDETSLQEDDGSTDPNLFNTTITNIWGDSPPQPSAPAVDDFFKAQTDLFSDPPKQAASQKPKEEASSDLLSFEDDKQAAAEVPKPERKQDTLEDLVGL
eukprot:Gregarina_sp_Pseudo_9__93@NODE_1062_length_1914_cov_27_850133_g994_i0_p1_GENE_NODE_1062_length_1914_cov_27_850133_g994_i0NODE_1062_length_1914_cov_27_850133_g994_i0_p1_ORF_typecomplete_len422_score53_63ENTH/PF01417_20/4_9e23_NODE_1062_length_1914_cov_27_850133_g994_i01171382